MRTLQDLGAGSLISERYAIEKPLGVLGNGPVYRAIDRHLQRRVTLRVFPAAGWQPGEQERFAADLRKATPLDHTNLAGIRDFGMDPSRGLGFVVYEPLGGVTLAMFLAQRPVPPIAALQITHDAAEGIGASHWAGLVHGEIHPGSVFFAGSPGDRRVRVEVLLPGLPLSIGESREVSAPARYAAPELLHGGASPTPASDVYSLGLVAYELLVGLPARWDETVTGSLRREDVEMPAANEIRPEIPAEVAEAIAGALHVDPKQRYDDGSVFALVLAHALDTAATTPPMAAIFEGMQEFLRDDVAPAPESGAGAAPEKARPPEATAAGAPRPTAAGAEPTSGSRAPAVPDRAATPRPIATVPATPASSDVSNGERGAAPDAGDGRPGLRRWAVPAAAAAAAAILGIGGTTFTLSARRSAPAADIPSLVRPIGQYASSEAPPAETLGGPGGPDLSAVDADSAPTPAVEPEEDRDEPGRVVEAPAPDPAQTKVLVLYLPEPTEVEPLSPSELSRPSEPGFDYRAATPGVEPLPDPDASAEVPTSAPELASDGGKIYGLAHVDEIPKLRNLSRLESELGRLVDRRAGPARGTVLVQFVVLASGKVDPGLVEVLDAPSEALRDGAREVVLQARFAPARIDHSPVNVRVRLKLNLAAQDV